MSFYAHDWPEQTRLCGFGGVLDGDKAMRPTALEAFLASGEPPVVFTPGTAMTQAHRFFEVSVRAVQDLTRRAILLTSHTEQLPRTFPATVLPVDYVPLAKLLPRCAAMVHHGGIGTCAASLETAETMTNAELVTRPQPRSALVCLYA